jgi:NTE family protein
VLAGGGARGAYEVGALAELLPRLPPDDRPRIVVGTSVGAINAAFVAATSDQPVAEALERGCEIWRQMRWESALAPLVSFAQLRIVLRSAADALRLPGARSWSMLDPRPLPATLARQVPFARIHENVEAEAITAAAVVATRASSSLSVVFCDSRGEQPATDHRRGIAYERARLDAEHVLASAAIPGAFPAVEVHEPPSARGWYFDGGTRLNTPIRPALDLGAERLIVVALHSPALGEVARPGPRPQILDGIAQLLQGVLVDPLVNDVLTLTTINRLLGEQQHAEGSFKRIPYILIAPETPHEIGEIAVRVYERLYGRRRAFGRRRGSVARLGRLLDVADDPLRGEMLSYLFFEPEFAEELIELGRRDARRWIAAQHDHGLWQVGPTG